MAETELGVEPTRTRTLPPLYKTAAELCGVVVVVTGALYALEVPIYLHWTIFAQQFYGLVLGITLFTVFLLFPATRRTPRHGVPWYDVACALIGLTCGMYIMVLYPEISYRVADITPSKVVLGSATVLLVVEATRRVYGPVLPILAILFVLYALFASHFPGMLRTRSIAWDRVAVDLFVGGEGMLGIIMGIVATIVLVFVVFGQLLFAMGGGTLFTDLAIAALGRYRGGPAKVAVIGSALFGSISNSAVANVVITGSVTIPMMKRIGYRPEVAGAVEACASTGGLVMPPVMSAVAFVMAEYLHKPYGEIVLAAALPAILYYGALLIQVDLEAGRTGMKGLPASEIPNAWKVLKRGWAYLLPLPILIYTLVWLLWAPEKAGMFAVLLLLVCGYWYVRHKPLRWWFETVAQAGLQVCEIIVVALLVGIILGVSSMTGMSFTFTEPLVQLGQYSYILLLVATALISLILGMGLPGIAIYFMQVTLIVPSLVKFGILPIAAHFFIFYFGVFSLITPPVAVSAIAAAGIAKSAPLRTGYEACKLGAVAFIVPFVFVFSPTLLAQGPLWLICINFLSACVGILALSISMRGYFMAPVAFVWRLVLFACALGLFLPVEGEGIKAGINVLSLVVGAALVGANWLAVKPRKRAAVT